MNMTKRLKAPTAAGWIGWLSAGMLLLNAGAAMALNSLNSVSVSQGKNDTQVVKLQFKEAVEAAPAAFSTSNPYRLVLDFADTANAIGRATESLNAGIIKNYQVVQAGGRTRLVINLTGPSTYELRQERNVVLAVLRGVGDQPGTQPPVHFAATGSQRAYGIRDVDFRRGGNGEGRITVTLSDPGVGIDIQLKGRGIQVDFLNTGLPRPLQRRLDVSDFATPAQLIETFEQDKATRMVVTPKGRWDYSAYQTGNQFVMEVRSLDDPQLAQPDKPVYSGEKLSLNFQNVEVRSVLQVIADFTGLNIIASDTVAGNVTLRLKDVPWDQALDIILKAKGLDKRATGNVIWIAPRDELAAKEKLELESKRAVAELEPLVTRSYPLNYIRADEASAVLSGLSRVGRGSQDDASCAPSSTGIKAEVTASGSGADGGATTTSGSQTTRTSYVNRVLSNRGGVSHDLTTNTLVVTDTPERHAAVEGVLKSVDLPTKQVMIEARVVVADDTFGRTLGARLGFKAQLGRNVGLSTTANDAGAIAAGGLAGSTTVPFNVDLPGTLISSNPNATLGFAVIEGAGNALLGLELQALEEDNRGKIVSNPRVVTTNLRPAVILQGTQIPYSTVSTEGTQTSFKDALLCLLVSPQVLNNDSIILNVEVTKDAQGESTAAGPAINVKRVKTQVRVNNGETAILGGIFEQTLRNDTDKVPLLGDIPILGYLFKSNHKQDDKTELLIFLTPRLLDDRLGMVR